MGEVASCTSTPTIVTEHSEKLYSIIREGLAEILEPKASPKSAQSEAKHQTVFYNPIQQFNRDLSVLAIRIFAEDLAAIREAGHRTNLSRNREKRRNKTVKRKELQEIPKKESTNLSGDVPTDDGKQDIEKPFVIEDRISDHQNHESHKSIKRRRRNDVLEEVSSQPTERTAIDNGEINADKALTATDDVLEQRLNSHSKVEKRKREENASDKGSPEPKKHVSFDRDEPSVDDSLVTNNKPKLPIPQIGCSSEETSEHLHQKYNRVKDLNAKEHILEQEDVSSRASEMDPSKNSAESTQLKIEGSSSSNSKIANTTNNPVPFRILDALSATGLRALRYAKEIPSVSSITANDLSSSATASIRLNVEHNGIRHKVHANNGDAKAHMYAVADSRGSPYHVIDLDPYGTVIPFLDAAVQAVSDGGLLCVTCTDSGVFASVSWLEKTFSQYGGLPWKGPQSHEAGLRLILNAIASSAARYGLAIEPLLSLSIDFYTRFFVRIRKSPAEVKFLASKTMMVYNCDQGCGSWTTQYLAQSREKTARNNDKIYTFSLAQAPSTSPYCEHCGFKTHLAGPMWGGPLHNPHFIQRILDLLPSLDTKVYGTIPRLEGMLTLALRETFDSSIAQQPNSTTAANPSNDVSSNTTLPLPVPSLPPSRRDPHPFFLHPSSLARVLHTSCPPESALRGALLHLGYRATRSHTSAGSIRTDAPWSVIWEVMREWVRQKSPVKQGVHKPGTAGWGIMEKDRSKKGVLGAKRELEEAIGKGRDVEALVKEVQAALWRIEQAKGSAADLEKYGEGSGHWGSDALKKLHELDVVFDTELGRESQDQGGKKMVRYQMNPRPDWGPMSKAKGGS
ncbi:MAG: hypothetical protein Q9190_006771 [Brigantiaea leucoxantha]